jgi:hypothetical protein
MASTSETDVTAGETALGNPMPMATGPGESAGEPHADKRGILGGTPVAAAESNAETSGLKVVRVASHNMNAGHSGVTAGETAPNLRHGATEERRAAQAASAVTARPADAVDPLRHGGSANSRTGVTRPDSVTGGERAAHQFTNLSAGRKAAMGNGRGSGSCLAPICRIAPGKRSGSPAVTSECITRAQTSSCCRVEADTPGESRVARKGWSQKVQVLHAPTTIYRRAGVATGQRETYSRCAA